MIGLARKNCNNLLLYPYFSALIRGGGIKEAELKKKEEPVPQQGKRKADVRRCERKCEPNEKAARSGGQGIPGCAYSGGRGHRADALRAGPAGAVEPDGAHALIGAVQIIAKMAHHFHADAGVVTQEPEQVFALDETTWAESSNSALSS